MLGSETEGALRVLKKFADWRKRGAGDRKVRGKCGARGRGQCRAQRGDGGGARDLAWERGREDFLQGPVLESRRRWTKCEMGDRVLDGTSSAENSRCTPSHVSAGNLQHFGWARRESGERPVP